MKIVADSQIPLVREAFSGIGDLQLCTGRTITPDKVRDADILLVRSVTPVNADLLDGSRIRFVATATSGIDHIDTACLQKSGVGFASARGSNAQSVVEYVLSSLFVLAEQKGFDPVKKTTGIIGCGEVGSRLWKALQTLGMNCLPNDPPLKDQTGDPAYLDLEHVTEADIISLHVPLTTSGPYPTQHLVDDKFLSQLAQDTVLINTSRGGVVCGRALKKHIHQNREFSAVVDVWEHEPGIDPQLLAAVAIGTPHIAGYSTDAKIRATTMIYKAVCSFFNLPEAWSPAGGLLGEGSREFNIAGEVDDADAIAMAVKAHYDVRSDAASLRRLLEIDRKQTGLYFDELRKNYPLRREFSATTVRLTPDRHALANRFAQLGFTVMEQ
jgi:erythronate-4-phosphate dehydrogenase